MRRGWWAVLLLAVAVPGHVAAAGSQPKGAQDVLHDPDFGVTTSAPALRRRVRMLQWQPVAGGYAMVWDDTAAAPGGHPLDYRNPLPRVGAMTWPARPVMFQRHPLAPDVVRELGVWEAFRPSFSALPGTSGRHFQPEGDGLGTAENPLDPKVGDLRVTWEALHMPSLAGRVELRNGVWQLRRSDPRRREPNEATPAPTSRALRPRVIGLLGATVLATLIVAGRLRRRR